MRYRVLLAVASAVIAIACGGSTSTGGAPDGGATGGGGGVAATGGSGAVGATGGSGAVGATGGSGGVGATGGNGGVGATGGGAGTGGVDGGSCVPPAPGALGGSYLFTLSTAVAADSPILFVAQVGTVAVGGVSALQLTLQALDAKDRKTPVGSPINLSPILIGSDGQLDGTHQLLLPIDGRANPLLYGSNLVATVVLQGRICGVADFYCGTVDGQVTQPLAFPLSGSTYTFDHFAAPASLPDPPLIDCAKDAAGPPPP